MRIALGEVLVLLNDCVEMKASHTAGYARVTYDGKRVFAHRLVFFQTYGYWPDVCRHTCDNPPCVNPEHLVDGTHGDNIRDMMERGRGRGQFKPSGKGALGGRSDEERKSDNKVRMGHNKTYCRRGHILPLPYIPGKARRCMESECRKARRYNALGR